MDLAARTLDALDWPVITAALARHASTIPGRDAALGVSLPTDAITVVAGYEAVREVQSLAETGEGPPLHGITNIESFVDQASRDVVLDLPDLRDTGHCLTALHRLRVWIDTRADALPRLHAIVSPIQLEAELRDTLAGAFDELGELSATAWPELARLRRRVSNLEADIKRTLQRIIQGDAWGDVLQDRFITERDGRFVVPVRAGSRRSLGIVHDTSQTGETVFIEPAEVVAKANGLRETRAAVRRELRRIQAELTAVVARHAASILNALNSATAVDLTCARYRLGDQLRGRIPTVGRGGAICLREARHPVLELRGIDVVANDLMLDARRRCLVLSGPNTGGKTVALKTLGLAALMCRASIPIPARDDSRVDVFPSVLADVGDLQSVEGDLSTFSGHVEVLKAMMAGAGPDALVLLDEIGVGTDPVQGAALARAVLEALVDGGARVAVTTHYADLKGMATEDPRFSPAAVQYANGRPTYRVEPGLAGQSHAFAIARRLAMPGPVVDRAEALIDQGTLRVNTLMEQLEEAQAEVRDQARTLAEQARQQAEQARRLAERERALADRRRDLERRGAAAFKERIRAREEDVKALIAALQDNPDLKLAGRTLAQLRKVRGEATARAQDLTDIALPPPADPQPGDLVLVRALHKKGRIARVLGKGRYEVTVGTMPMKLKRAELARLDGRGQPIAEPPKAPAKPPPPPQTRGPLAGDDIAGVRVDGNTCDLRGKRVHEAVDLVEVFLDRMAMEDRSVGFILHGHGTGALKQAIRAWLPTTSAIRGWRPCRPGEGGDAFTIVAIA